MPHAGEIGTKRRAAEIVQRSRQRAPCGVAHDRLERRKQALTDGLSQRNQARAGRYPVRRHRMQEGVKRRRERNSVRGADKTNRNRIDDGGLARGNKPIQQRVMPRGSRDLDERPALRRGLEMALARRNEGGSKLGEVRQQCIIAGRRSPIDVRQKDTVANPGAVRQHGSEPLP